MRHVLLILVLVGSMILAPTAFGGESRDKPLLPSSLTWIMELWEYVEGSLKSDSGEHK